MPELCIIHTSDLHDRLTREKAARLRRLKEGHDALLIDCGDAIRAPNVAVMPWRERAVPLMDEAGYDAMGLGNREYFFRQSGMRWKWGHASFPIVASNLRGRDGKAIGGAATSLVLATGDIRLGLFSLMPTMVAPGHGFERVSDTRFVPWREAAREAVTELNGRCDLVAALFHRPPAEIAELVDLCPEVRFVLAAHGHLTRDTVEVLSSGVVVSHAGLGARHARVLGLRVPEGTVTMDELVSLDPDAPA